MERELIYADSDFFLGMFKEMDWLKDKAFKAKVAYPNIITSAATVIEVLHISKRYGVDPEIAVIGIFSIAKEVKGLDRATAFLAMFFIKEKGVGVFDAFHAAYAHNLPILSSDKVFDEIGLHRIALEKA